MPVGCIRTNYFFPLPPSRPTPPGGPSKQTKPKIIHTDSACRHPGPLPTCSPGPSSRDPAGRKYCRWRRSRTGRPGRAGRTRAQWVRRRRPAACAPRTRGSCTDSWGFARRSRGWRAGGRVGRMGRRRLRRICLWWWRKRGGVSKLRGLFLG